MWERILRAMRVGTKAKALNNVIPLVGLFLVGAAALSLSTACHTSRGTETMTEPLFPSRIDSDRLRFERLSHETTDVFELYEFTSDDAWQDHIEETMPWFRFQRVDEVAGFIDHAEQEWRDRNSARYLLRSKETDDAIVGTTAFIPEWEKRRGGSDIVLSRDYWGRDGVERGAVFVELTFETYDLYAYCSSCAPGNARSRRMIEKVVDSYGGQDEGCLRQFGSPHPDGAVTDQHRFSIVREEYERATETADVLDFDVAW